MKKLVFIALAATFALSAQTSKDFLTEAKGYYEGTKNNITRAADRMPESDYGFKPTPLIRSYGEAIGHIADIQMTICSIVTGSGKKSDSSKVTSKAELASNLKASFEECDKAFASVTEANAAEVIGQGFFKRTRLSLLNFNTMHNNEMYGTISVYLRLKSLVPPSSDPKK